MRNRLDRAHDALRRAHELWNVDQAFGLMVIETAVRRSTVLLGSASHTSDEGLATIDWRTAPLAEAYFGLSPGEAWEGPGGEVRLVERVGLRTRNGEVQELLEVPGPRWPRPARTSTGFRSPLDVTLDEAQLRVVNLPKSKHVLVLGEAGFGKTTVALRRLELLAQRGLRCGVVVPTEGLRRLTERALEHRGVDIETWTFERWARTEAQRAFKLPHRESQTTGSRTITFKRHPALVPVLEQFARRRSRGPTTRRDLLHFFGDTAWLEQVRTTSGGTLLPASVAEVADHTRVQFLHTAEHEWAHVTDATRLHALDGARLDEGTPDEDANSIDADDYPVLFALEAARARLQRRQPRNLGRWDVLFIDEAQEFAPLELELLGRGLKPGGVVVVAGDAAQQLDETTAFRGWDDVMASLEARGFEQARLEVNYRCPPEVTTLARGVLEGRPPEGHETSNLVHLDAPHAPHQLSVLINELRALSVSEAASVAVICRTAEAARTMARQLGYGVSVHLALNGDFRFRPGVVVTCVAEVKGLEFDVVVVPEANGATWNSTAEARRALYVAVTRATRLLVLTRLQR